MVLQTGYFDDSGSDAGSWWYVLAGFIAPVEQWKSFSIEWAEILKREELSFFKMSHAMAMDGQFRRGWTVPLRDKVILELVNVVEAINPWRIESMVDRRLFDTFVKGLLQTDTFADPYFMLFYQIVLSAAANAERIDWNANCEFIFDEQGKLGDNAISKWEWLKENIDGLGTVDFCRHLGSPPIFRNDVISRPLQAADMFAWLIRDCMSKGARDMEEISRVALKHLEGRERVIRLHITKEMLMKLGASFMVGKARAYGHL
jgi:hypothetical protein